MTERLLEIDALSLQFPTFRGAVQALRGVSLHVDAGEIVGLVGESGCGKSVTAMTATRLLPEGRYRIAGGRVRLFGHDPFALSAGALQALRGRMVSTIFQEPMNALNPSMRIGHQMVQVIRRHQHRSAREARALAASLLADMQIADVARVLRQYPFELSGGMRQRVLIAMAFSCQPRLILADEPTTALDVTIQAQILGLLRERARASGTAILFISHDLGVVAQLCDRVVVMYAGMVVESGTEAQVLRAPAHPYTAALLACLPERAEPKQPLGAIAGSVASLIDPPPGCSFRPRCSRARDRCTEQPGLTAVAEGHRAACWFPETAGAA